MSLTIDAVPKNSVQIRYKGKYDFEGLYRLIRSWLDERRYDFMETLYKDKVAGPFGNEVELKLDPELKVNEFIKFHIHIETKFFDVKEFEAELHGKKKRICEGRFVLWFGANVEFDYTEKYKKYEGLLNFLVTKILKRYYEVKYIDVLTYDLYDLHAKIKKFLRMETEYNAY